MVSFYGRYPQKHEHTTISFFFYDKCIFQFFMGKCLLLKRKGSLPPTLVHSVRTSFLCTWLVGEQIGHEARTTGNAWVQGKQKRASDAEDHDTFLSVELCYITPALKLERQEDLHCPQEMLTAGFPPKPFVFFINKKEYVVYIYCLKPALVKDVDFNKKYQCFVLQ